MTKNQSLEVRFHAKIRKEPGGCWIWTGSRTGDSYGTMTVARKTRRATHVALELAGTPLPPGMYALHRCDNPPCVNPSHLYAGTQAENMREFFRKYKPDRRGVLSSTATFTEQQVVEIRRRVSAGERTYDLAIEFGASPTSIQRAAYGRTYLNVEYPAAERPLERATCRCVEMRAELVAIRQHAQAIVDYFDRTAPEG